MAAAKEKPKSSRQLALNLLFWVLLVVIVAAGVYFRLAALDSDPPMYFDGYGQSLTTDPYHYVFHARNELLFGESDPFNQERWRVFEFTLVSGLSYILFALFGITRINANLAGLIPALLAIFLFTAAMRKFVNRWGLLLILFLLLSNKVLYVYGRLPYTEDGLLLIAAALFFIFAYYRNRLWGIITMGALVALAGLSCKIFGFLMIVPVIISIWLENAPNRKKEILAVIGSTLAAVLLWFILIFGGRFGAFTDFLFKQTIGLYGFPEAFKSPLTFIAKLINFGNDSLFYFLAPVLGLAGFLGFLVIIRFHILKSLKENLPILFLIVWFIAGQIFFMPENYRPIRYIFMLYFPLAGIAGYLFSQKFDQFKKLPPREGKIFIAVLFIALWVIIDQIAYNSYALSGGLTDSEKDSAMIVWITLVPAALLTFLELRYHLLRGLISLRYAKMAAFVLILAGGLWNFGQDYNQWEKQRAYAGKEAGEDLAQVLGENAVISGPLTPTLLLENKLKGLIYAAGVSNDDPDLFRKIPVTHIAVDGGASGILIKEFPYLEKAEKVTEYWIRNSGIVLVRITDLTGNAEASSYKMTDYEIGWRFKEEKQNDSALFYMERFAAKYPNNKSVLKAISELYALSGKFELGLKAIQRAADLYPDDFSVLSALAIYLHKMYIGGGEKSYQVLAYQAYMKTVIKNPYKADDIKAVSTKIAEMRRSSQ
jgi:4-amino-4-deoxy-L-arabinose transferase-like glycosyltransferase